jgi:FMN phosphatase YigB (HAD superfamily)
MTTLIFDWGGTIMEDYGDPGPMYTWDRVAWIPAAEEALKALSARFTCCIATGAGASDTAALVKALERVGAGHYFRGFFTALEIGFDKPDPRFFTEICLRMGVVPSSCIMTGNDYARDITGARAAGLRTVFFNAEGTEGTFPEADEMITRMSDLPGAVERIIRHYSP